MRKSIIALLLLSVVLVLVSCSNKPVIIKPETTTNETEPNTHDTETICTTTSSDDNPIENPVVVFYSDFGAIGDGKTDDFGAILAAHEYANENNYSVKATEGAPYLISSDSIGKQIEIKTDTDWTNASFIIDDSVVEVQENKYYTLPIFRVAPSIEGTPVTDVKRIQKGQENIGFVPGEKCLAVIENSASKVFVRTGMHAGKGDSKREILLLDKDGNVDESTPVNWDYSTITSLIIYPIDESTLTIKGGSFTTIANTQPAVFTYYHRSITVERSNTIIEGVSHFVMGENDDGGAPYNGFIFVRNCGYVTIRNCIFTPHYIFGDTSQPESASYGYDVHVNISNNVRFENCTQTISIDDENYWGVFTSNFARNIILDKCTLSRFDAHRGVYNVTITNCTLGHQGIRFVGFGFCTIENTTVRSSNLVVLRGDYGATFEGKITIRNCRLEPQKQLWSKSELIYAKNDCNHYYGYLCYFPEIEIDGLYVDDSNATTGYTGLYILPVYTETDNWKTDVPFWKYSTPARISITGYETFSGKHYKICRIPELYPDLTVNCAENNQEQAK